MIIILLHTVHKWVEGDPIKAHYYSGQVAHGREKERDPTVHRVDFEVVLLYKQGKEYQPQ